MTKDLPRAKRIGRRFNLVVWSLMGFFLAGYLPSLAAQAKHISPQLAVTISLALAAMGVIPYAAKIGHPLKSALVAGMLGALTGLALTSSFLSADPTMANQARSLQWKYAGGIAFFCALIGATFGHLARRRRQRAQDEWRRYE